MIFTLLLLLLAVSIPAYAQDIWYVHPTGSGTACTENSPCDWIYGTLTKANNSDTVRFFDGTYNTPSGGWTSNKSGTSNTNRLTFEAINRRQARIRYVGNNDATHTFDVLHDNYMIRGLEIDCEAANGNNSWDCLKAGTTNQGGPDESAPSVLGDNITFDDLYVHSSGHAHFHCTAANNVEIRNTTFDLAGETTNRGEGYYLSSCCRKNNPCTNFRSFNNVISRFAENGIDFKDQSRTCDIRYNIFTDHRTRGSPDEGTTGTAVFVSQDGGGTGSPTSAAGNYIRDSMIFRGLANWMFASTDGHRFDAINNVIWTYDPISGAQGKLNGSNETASALSYGNIHCPAADNISENFDKDGGNPPNQLNRPTSECNTRINQIIGIPGIASCEIGSINNTTVVVNLQANVHGPISSVGSLGQLAVQYALTDQTETAVQLTTGTQARITMASAPANGGVAVRIVPAVGAIKNSAFIGGKDCNLSIDAFKSDYGGTSRNPNPVPGIGGGVCGSNIAATPITCTNNVSAPAPSENLSQAVWRFYGQDGAEGHEPLSPELTNVSMSKGQSFRWRVGVRGGTADAPSRAYELGARICSPTCGAWAQVTSNFSSTGVTYRFDAEQENLAPTTNQLSLGGKSFLAGVFSEESQFLPAVAIQTTHQVEWEFSLVLPAENNPLNVGNTLELRVQHADGTALATYNLPSITITDVAAGYGGSMGGGVLTGGVVQ